MPVDVLDQPLEHQQYLRPAADVRVDREREDRVLLLADKAGDQELDPAILQRARIFVDDIRQCRTDGEINVPLTQGLITEDDVTGEIGQVVAGRMEGRTSDDQITMFDSTGIALQDSATVPLEVERARAAGVGIEKKMISG